MADRTDEVSSKHGFEVVDETDEAQNMVLRWQIELTKSVTIHTARRHGFEVVDETDEV
ncbi:hypothetical protein [Streptococcus pneumoniae]|uniref:hypothetical protein n=1 Tax=Streptococcus pneumoniae TaxID=1313 RepID=UPI00177D09C7|nr:hypothetical protein [Streptococcus pneumoniae]